MLIAGGIGVALCLGVLPRSKVSMMSMRPPQHGHGRGSTHGSSGDVDFSGSGAFTGAGMASNARAFAMLAARLPFASRP